MELRQFIDHTLLLPTATPDDIRKLCSEAVEHQFYAVCVNSCHAKLAVDMLRNEKQKVAATVGFPLGSASTESKLAETKSCVANGVDEIDMVMNIGYLKAGLLDQVGEEISVIKKALGNRVLKVIIETCYLSKEEKKQACLIAAKAGADYVKTSTGFAQRGASLEDVEIIKNAIGNKARIKASGGRYR